MSTQTTMQGFDRIYKALHWSTALLILGLLIVGFIMIDMPFSPFKLELYSLHKSFGMIVLFLGFIRVIWRFTHKPPEHLPSHTTLERIAAKSIHTVLYISIFVMPLSGWVMSSAGDYPISFFGITDIPAITQKNEQIFEASKAIHLISSLLLIACIMLHIIGALKHHFIDRDITLERMSANKYIALIGLTVTLTATLLGATHLYAQIKPKTENIATISAPTPIHSQASTAQEWIINHKKSAISVMFNQYAQDVDGYFENWNGTIYFDPEKLDKSKANITIDIASLKTGSGDRDQQAQGSEWFNAPIHPQAIFKGELFEKIDANRYRVSGHLTIRNITHPISFPFELKIAKDKKDQKTATMNAKLALERLDFGIGQGQWETTETIGNKVEVTLNITAQSTP